MFLKNKDEFLREYTRDVVVLAILKLEIKQLQETIRIRGINSENKKDTDSAENAKAIVEGLISSANQIISAYGHRSSNPIPQLMMEFNKSFVELLNHLDRLSVTATTSTIIDNATNEQLLAEKKEKTEQFNKLSAPWRNAQDRITAMYNEDPNNQELVQLIKRMKEIEAEATQMAIKLKAAPSSDTFQR